MSNELNGIKLGLRVPFVRWCLILFVACNLSLMGILDLKALLSGIPRILRARSTKNKLVIFNAIGKRNNLALIEQARKIHFRSEDWDCVGFMFAYEDQIPNEDEHLRTLLDELGCTIPRMPGIDWGTFLLTVTPAFVSNYEYLALVLDDVFLPDTGPNPVNTEKLIQQMKDSDIGVISPAVMGDSHNVLELATELGLHSCTTEINMIESYLQLFTVEAWNCYYKMLHYSGIRGWCYNLCFKSQCPDITLAQDFSMIAWHVGNEAAQIPAELVSNPILQSWTLEPSTRDFTEVENYQVCARLGCGEPAFTQEMLNEKKSITSASISMNPIDCADFSRKFSKKYHVTSTTAEVNLEGENPTIVVDINTENKSNSDEEESNQALGHANEKPAILIAEPQETELEAPLDGNEEEPILEPEGEDASLEAAEEGLDVALEVSLEGADAAPEAIEEGADAAPEATEV
jgi:hypothetical protein